MFDGFVGAVIGGFVLFNDPFPCPDPCLRGARMAAAMRVRLKELAARWRASGHTLGFGVGIAHGYATIGSIGFEGCAEAGDGHILVDFVHVLFGVSTEIARETCLPHRSRFFASSSIIAF